MRSRFVLLLFSFIFVASVNAHDLFLKLDTYFLQPKSRATVRLLNGTFQASEGVVLRDRLRDISLVTPANGVLHAPPVRWRDEGKTTLLEMKTAEAGTYIVGMSTKPKEIDLAAADFNDYLAHDGLPDTLAERRKNNQLERNVRERYSKHVRAIFQVGNKRTENYKTPLDYPVEIIPQKNPYSLKAGETLEVLCTLNGKPIANQFVIAGWETKNGVQSPPLDTRTDSRGLARFTIEGAGKWYVKMIHMTPLADPLINYESRWATLTFEIR